MDRKCSILVLNYNGKPILQKYLSSVVEAAEYENTRHEIVIVDNNSNDDSIEYVANAFHSIKIIRMKQNKYLFSYNEAVKEISTDYIMLLNNDVKIKKGCIGSLLKHFDDKNVFAVMPKVLSDNPAEEYLHRCPGVFINGILYTAKWEKMTGAGYTLFAHGGASIYDKYKYMELGGFNEIYSPGYCEDNDLSYNAWMRGWKVIYEPEAEVFHEGGGTFNNLMKKGVIERQRAKVNIIFMLRNIEDKRMLLECLFWTMIRIARETINGNTVIMCALKDVLMSAGRIIRERKTLQKRRIYNDRQILKIIRDNIS